METYELVLSAIGSVGFPIVACCFMGWFVYQFQQTMNKTLSELTIAINTLTTEFKGHIDRTEGDH